MNNKEIEEQVAKSAKSYAGKLEVSLVPTQIIRDIAEVRMYGNKKYNTSNNWILVDKDRYKDALLRHTLAFLDDENSIDEESGIPHYRHMAANLAFICEMKRKDWEQRKQYLKENDPELKDQIQKYINNSVKTEKDGDNYGRTVF